MSATQRACVVSCRGVRLPQYYQTTQQTHVQYYGAHPQQAMQQPVVPQMHTVVHQTTVQRGIIPRVCVTGTQHTHIPRARPLSLG